MEAVVHYVRVDVRSRQGLGALWPRYDSAAGLVEVTTDDRREWVLGVNIGASVVFDLDVDRVLVNFDLLIPRRRWKVGHDVHRPKDAVVGALQFSAETVREKTFALSVAVWSDPARRYLHVELQASKYRPPAIELSERCFAFVRNGVLHGFLLDLAEDT